MTLSSILLSSNLVKHVNAFDESGQQAQREGELLFRKLPLGEKSRAAGVGADAVMAVVKVDHRFCKRYELVVVRGLGQLCRREVRAVEAERARRGQGRDAMADQRREAGPAGVRVCTVFQIGRAHV